MKNILIVNLDNEERVAYSVLVAASLFHVNPETKINILCSSGAGVLKSTGLFDKVFEVSALDVNEKTLSKKHPEILNENWDFIINHSSDVAAAAMISMLDAEEIFGPSLKDQKIVSQLSHQSFSSYMLTELNGRVAPCHISQLYFEIVNLQHTGKKLPSAWSENQLDAMKDKMEELRTNFQKKNIVLIDAGISDLNNLGDLNFLLQFIKAVDSSAHHHPVLLSKSVGDDSFIISKIKEAVSEELTIASVESEGLLGLLASVDIVVTDNLRLKSYSDLALTPSVFLNRKSNLPFMDFSIHPKSLLFVSPELNPGAGDMVFQLCRYISGETSEVKLTLNHDLYKTIVDGNSVTLEAISQNVNSEYYKWVLCNRFFTHIEKQSLPEVSPVDSSYGSLISAQRDLIRSIFNVLLEKAKTQDSSDSIESLLMPRLGNKSDIFQLALDYLNFQQAQSENSLKKFLTRSKPVIQDLMKFLNSEEARVSEKSITMIE